MSKSFQECQGTESNSNLMIYWRPDLVEGDIKGRMPGSSPGGSREFEGGDGVGVFGKIHI